MTFIKHFCQLNCRTSARRLLTQRRPELLSLRVCDIPSIPLTATKAFFSEVCCLAQVMPATNAASEHSFSDMRHLKTYLCSTT